MSDGWNNYVQAWGYRCALYIAAGPPSVGPYVITEYPVETEPTHLFCPHALHSRQQHEDQKYDTNSYPSFPIDTFHSCFRKQSTKYLLCGPSAIRATSIQSTI